MKIKKFNESLEIINLDDIDVYFTYFIDQGRYSSTLSKEKEIINIKIEVEDEKMFSFLKPDIKSYIKGIRILDEEFIQIKDSLDKLKIEHDEMYISFYLNDRSEHDSDSDYRLSIAFTNPKNLIFDDNRTWTKY